MQAFKSIAQQKTQDTLTHQITPRRGGSKVKENKLKRTFEQLMSIPCCNLAGNILHLYLSHNNISCLAGIEKYESLISLNVSYNSLSKISQLLLLRNKHLLTRIALRMNNFQFGYQDYAVCLFTSLTRIDDILLPPFQERAHIFRTALNFSYQAIQFRRHTRIIIQQLTNIQNNSTKQFKMQVHDVISYPIIKQLSDLLILPKQQLIERKQIKQLVSLCQSISNISFDSSPIVKQMVLHEMVEDYQASTCNIFEEFCKRIVLKFASRHNYSLKNSLDKSMQMNDVSMLTAFGRLGLFNQTQTTQHHPEIKTSAGGYYFANILSHHPAKFIRKLSIPEIKSNPLLSYLQAQTSQNFHSNKWTPLRNLQFQSHNPKRNDFFERVPVFLYDKNYLCILTQIFLEDICVILKLYHDLHESCLGWKNMQQAPLTDESQEIDFKKQKELKQIIDAADKSDSESILSFGEKNKENIQTVLNVSKKSSFPQKNHQSLKQPNFITNHLGRINQQNQFQKNLQKYSLHEINLAYKVFVALRRNFRRKKLSQTDS